MLSSYEEKLLYFTELIKLAKMKKMVLLSTGMAVFLVAFMGSSFNIALPSIGTQFGLKASTLGWLALIYLLSAGIFAVPAGKLGDLKGRKKVFLWGIFLYAVGSFLSGIASNAQELLIFRFVQGIGASMIFATSVAILTASFPLEKRGQALGINVSCTYIGLSAGPFLGGILTENFTWRSLFFVNAILSILTFFITLKTVKEEPIKNTEKMFDGVGTAIYTLALSLLIIGLSKANLWMLLGGTFLLFLFFFIEQQHPSPLVNIRLFRNNLTFSLSNLAALLNYSATFGVGFLLSLFLQQIKGFSPQHAGLILMIQPITMALLAPIAGMLSDRIEPRVVASFGMLLTTVSLIILSTLRENTGIYFIMASLFILGLGLALFSSPNTNAIMSSVEREFYSLASAMVSTMRLIGQMTSMALITLILSVFSFSFLQGLRASFRVLAFLCIFGIFTSLGRGSIRKVKGGST
jgi:EmrB/QacA subfamily drug resistance transporter